MFLKTVTELMIWTEEMNSKRNWEESTTGISIIFTLQLTQLSDYRLKDRGSIPGIGKIFFSLASVSRPALRPTQPPNKWVLGSPLPGVKLGRGVKLTNHHI
jgi:hypothetical protein